MGLTDFFMGSRPDMRLPCYLSPIINELNNYDPGPGMALKEYKHLIKQYGKDPASLATMATIHGAKRNRHVDEDFMTGANRMIQEAGGEQAIALEAVRQNAKAHAAEQTGEEMVNEANSKYFSALQGYEGARNDRTNAELGKYGRS